MTRAEIDAELRLVNDQITNAYWTFTRTKRGKPPVMVVPEAYRRRRELETMLREMSRATSEHLVLLPGKGMACDKGCATASTFARCRVCSKTFARCACEDASRAAAACCPPPWEAP